LRCLAISCKRTSTQGIGEHPIEILNDARPRGREPFLAEEPHQQFNRGIASFGRHVFDLDRQSSLPCGLNDRAFRRVADGLNAMTVGVQHKSAVIVGVILGPQPRRTIVAPASSERRRVKGVYRFAAGSAEAEMRARNWGFDLGFPGDRKLDPERARCITVIGATILAEVDDTHKPERAQSRVIEATTALDVSDAN
jgi:hypothetical protein